MEERNRELSARLERSDREHADQVRALMGQVQFLSSRLQTAPDLAPDSPGIGPGATGRAPARAVDVAPAPEYTGPVPEYETQPIEPNPFVSLAPGLSTIATPSRVPLESNFGPGFQFQTLDEEFLLQVHVQSQIEARIWDNPNDGAPFRDGFYLPRQRIFFNGRITRPIEYVFSINRGLGELNILETFLNFHPDDRFQVRFGRYFTPLGYDQFAIRNLWLPTPERSLFTTNLGPNRQVGLMGWGFLLDKRLDYAAGVFTGPRNSFEDRNNAKDFTGYLNVRPFQNSEQFEALRNWNLGTSVVYGRQDQPAVPLAFRVGAVAPTNAEQAELATAPFLTLNRDVLEQGPRLLGSVHSAFFNKGLSLIGEWNYGDAAYASPLLDTSAGVPISAFYATGAYFLTGEHVDRRAMVVPRRPLIPTREGQERGIGAWELVGRASQLTLGRELFDAGLADESRWANSATTYELGMNWYWNEHLKLYMFWLHGHFDDKVRYDVGDYRDDVDMFWLRFQLFY
jgi:phosphate-selective porin OprO/OprP